MITTILGYLEHASYRKNFSRAFVPWYIGRPVMGMLLGLVFYFVIKGGLWALVPVDGDPGDTLNLYGLAGIGSLVGLFSKDAIEKLREVFHTLFSTERSVKKKLLSSLPKELREKVYAHLEDNDSPPDEDNEDDGEGADDEEQ